MKTHDSRRHWPLSGMLRPRIDRPVMADGSVRQLDTKLAPAYFLRDAAFGALGDSHSSVSDIVTALRLDPSLERYVTFKGEDASITLPP